MRSTARASSVLTVFAMSADFSGFPLTAEMSRIRLLIGLVASTEWASERADVSSPSSPITGSSTYALVASWA